jgi:hypothetical protein
MVALAAIWNRPGEVTSRLPSAVHPLTVARVTISAPAVTARSTRILAYSGPVMNRFMSRMP